MGDCYSGERGEDTFFQEGEQLQFATIPQPKPWVGCVDNEMKACSAGNLECSGQERSNYVFTLRDSTYSQDIYIILQKSTCFRRRAELP